MKRISGIRRADPIGGRGTSASVFHPARPIHSTYPIHPCSFSPRPLRLCGESRAFTLVDLLVVLAAIGVLAALVMPVLAGAREKGRQAACASNLRQLALANGLYAEDHDGYFAPAAQGFLTRDDRRWFGVRGADGRFEPRDGPLVPVAVKSRRAGDEQRMRLSRTIVEEAIKSRKAILSADAASDERGQNLRTSFEAHL